MTGTGLTPLPGRDRLWHTGLLVLGLHNWQDHDPGTRRFSIRAACPHPGFDLNTMENDLLLLQVGRRPRGRLRGGAGAAAVPGRGGVSVGTAR